MKGEAKIIKWSIFALLVLTFPSFFFALFFVGFFPAIAIFLGTFKAGSGTFSALFPIHLIVYVLLYYLLAYLYTKAVLKIAHRQLRLFVVIASIASLIAMAFFPIYGGGYSEIESVNWLGSFHAWK